MKRQFASRVSEILNVKFVSLIDFGREIGWRSWYTSYGHDNRRVRVSSPGRGRFFPSPRRPDRFWGPSSLLSKSVSVLFLRR
jgi:hypothetical protein